MSGRSSERYTKGKQRPNMGKQYKSSWIGFVDIPLTDSQKEGVAGDVAGGLAPSPDAIQAFLDAGYKLSLVNDEMHHCAVVSLTGVSPDCVNAGYTMTARGPNWEAALAVLEYKAYVICEAGPWIAVAETQPSQFKLWG